MTCGMRLRYCVLSVVVRSFLLVYLFYRLLPLLAALSCGFRVERDPLGDDLRREALTPSSLCKIFVKRVLYQFLF